MQTWLASAPLPLPTPVSEPPAEDSVEGMGTVTLARGEAALVLKGRAGELYRLSWERVGGQPVERDRRRALPAGEYEILSLRQVDRTRAGEVWHTSATGRQLGRLVVEDGETESIEVDATIRIGRGLRAGKQVAMTVTHPTGAGLTIYKDGRRIPVAYRLVAADGEVLRHGPMNYG